MSRCFYRPVFHKIPKISLGAYISQRPFLRDLFLEGLISGEVYLHTERDLCFKIDWASLIVGRKFTVFASSYFVFEGNFASVAPPPPRGGLIFGGANQQRVFCVTGLGGLYLEGGILGGAYFRNFTVS